LLVHSRNPI